MPSTHPRLALVARSVTLGAIFCSSASSLLRADEHSGTVMANCLFEKSFTAAKDHPDPFNGVELDVVFRAPDGRSLRMPAFWAGGRTWRVRYASRQEGVHTFRTVCSDPTDSGLHGIVGRLEVGAYRGTNPLYRHGAVRVAADARHFAHADGTPFLWLGDTWWMGLCRRLEWPAEFQALARDRVSKGFNVVQIVAGLYPDMPAFDPRGANEAGFPWEKGYTRINPEYFERADRRIAWLADSGLTPCIVGAWGYHLPWLGVERMKQHWRYLVGRYAARPVVWCVAGEETMPYYLSPTKEADRAFQKKGWTEVAAYLRALDPYRRPITVHPSGAQSSREMVNDVALIDIDMLQTGHGDRASIPDTIRLVRTSYAAEPPKPTVNGECCYEGILNTSDADVQRFMVWSCFLSGAAGYTYGANGIWQVNRRGAEYGKSPHGGNWGNTPWDEAMRLPGSRQVGLAKQLLARHGGEHFQPHPEWVSFEGKVAAARWGAWIWYPEGNPAVDAPTERRYFRRSFEIPRDRAVASAVLRVASDDRFTASLNGARLGSQLGWTPPREFRDVARLLKPGTNVLAVLGENLPAPVPKNPAGLLCGLEIEFRDGSKAFVGSDPAWRCSRTEEAGWQSVGFDDSRWANARVIAPYGGAPWGVLGGPSSAFIVPYAAGVAGKVRIIYLPDAGPIRVQKLEAGKQYRAAYFNPITGRSHDVGSARPGADGTWTPPKPPVAEQDWVLVLEE